MDVGWVAIVTHWDAICGGVGCHINTLGGHSYEVGGHIIMSEGHMDGVGVHSSILRIGL